MAQAKTPKVEAEETMDKGTLQQKAQEEQMEQLAHKIVQEEVRKTTTQIRVMQNATTVTNMGIIQVNVGRSKMISQDKQMWLM